MPCTLGSLVLSALLGAAPQPAPADITLIGTASIPGNATDKSGLTGVVGDGVPHNRLGSFGSSIDYTGKDDLYIACDDRGPGDGAALFQPRFQTFRIAIKPGDPSPVQVELVCTTLLTDEDGHSLSGYAGAFDAEHPSKSLRFDPEGVRLSTTGSLFISDEYGPFVDEFSTVSDKASAGRRLRRFAIPSKFLITHPSAEAKQELPPHNTSGRQSNRGFEGLATSPDKSRLWTILQSPLIQDSALSTDNKRIGRNTRILELVIATGATRELVYRLESGKNGVNELLALNDHELLALERDGNSGIAASSRALYKIDIAGATDVSAIDALPTSNLPESIKPVSKSPWLDFTDKRFGLAGANMPEKVEGLTFGPNLSDGRRTLIVTTDNDLRADQPSWFWVFAFADEVKK
jgi:hypothetical protein